MSENNAEAIADVEVDDDEVILTRDENNIDIKNPKILGLPVCMTISVGKARLSVKDILALTPDSVIDLDSKIQDPADIYVGERLIARGELIENENGGLGVRLTEICDLAG